MSRLLPALLFVLCTNSYAQTALSTATLQLTLTTSGGTPNRSAIAYNPNQQLYYSVNAGSASYMLETFDAAGNNVSSVAQGFDYRGAWWNPNTNQLEGNGYSNTGIWIQNLDANYYPLNSGVNDVPSTSGPDAQSCGDYDYIDDEILYYNNGTLYRHTRSANTLISSVSVTGLPVAPSSLTWNSVAYTGIPGMEAGLYDYVNKTFYFIDKQSGAYVASCQLPGTAPAGNYMKMGFENGYLWLFDGTNQWLGYKVVEQCSASSSMLTVQTCSIYNSPAGNQWTTSGTYVDTVANTAGCDSIITIDLTIMNSTSFLQETRCETYSSPAGNQYTSTGTYFDTIPNSSGCDSIIEINLTIVPNNLDNSVTVTGSQLWANQLVAAYQWVDCDEGNAAIPGEVNQFYDPLNTGNYAVEITADGCTVVSDCIYMNLANLKEMEQAVEMYPNPTTDILNVKSDVSLMEYRICDIHGKEITSIRPLGESIDMSSLEAGIYIVVFAGNGNTWPKRVVKK